MPRTPLGELKLNIVKGNQLTPFERGAIAALAADGQSQAEIGKKIGRRRETVRNVIHRFEINPTAEPAKRSGAPRTYTERDARSIIRVVRRNPKAKYRDIVLETGTKLSTTTIRRIIKESGPS